MKTLREVLQDAENRRVAVGHFNFSELTVLKAVGEAARELDTAVVVGVSESEREFVGVRQAVALVKAMRDEGLRIFLNADHTHSLKRPRRQQGLDLTWLCLTHLRSLSKKTSP
jgi:fructose/tagatose bisphosphate aldolase